MDHRAGKALRLRHRADIRRVFEEGRRANDRRMTLWAIPAPAGEGGCRGLPRRVRQPRSSVGSGSVVAANSAANHGTAGAARVGVAVSTRHGNAVHRNRLKRLCREAFRLIRHELPAGWDYVIQPRVGPPATLAELQDSLRRLARRVTETPPKDSAP